MIGFQLETGGSPDFPSIQLHTKKPDEAILPALSVS